MVYRHMAIHRKLREPLEAAHGDGTLALPAPEPLPGRMPQMSHGPVCRLGICTLLLTLFVLWGALPRALAQPDDPTPRTALLIIDIQEFYFPGGAVPLHAPETASANAGRLLRAARASGTTVIHVGHNARTGRAFHADVMPSEGEIVVMKDEVNAFLGTELHAILQEHGIERIVLCGMQTHMCVEAATRAASDLGYTVLVAGDACATRDVSYGERTVAAEQVHDATLATLHRVYGTVVSVDEALAVLAPATAAPADR